MALREELKRQHQQAPKESARHDNGKLGLQPQQDRLANHNQHRAAYRRQCHSDQEWRKPAVHALDENVVHEYLGKTGSDNIGYHESRARDYQQRNRWLVATQLTQKQADAIRLGAELLELFAALKGQHDAREGAIEFRHADTAAAGRGVVDVGVPAADVLQHHEELEIPVDDAWHRELAECRRLDAIAPCDESIATRRADDGARLTSVA